MKKIIIKYLIYIIAIVSIIYLIKTVNSQSKEIRDLRDKHTSELVQIDSLQQIHEFTQSQFKYLILKKDSALNAQLKEKDIKINQLNNIIKTSINQTIVTHDTIINHVPIHKDTIIHFKKKIECLTLYGQSNIYQDSYSLIIDSLNFNFNITVIDYYDIIYWYNFRKKREYGYKVIGFRNHYINKTTATSDCFGDKIKLNLYKIKK